jgi:hypothetical protein
MTEKNFQRARRLNDSLRRENDLRQEKIDNFEKVIVPAYKSRITEKDFRLLKQQESFDITKVELESEITRQKKKKWTFATWGYILGIASAVLAFIFVGI